VQEEYCKVRRKFWNYGYHSNKISSIRIVHVYVTYWYSLQMGFGSVTLFIGSLDTACDYTLQDTVTNAQTQTERHTHSHTHTLLSSVTGPFS
jgi:hypothetical protein